MEDLQFKIDLSKQTESLFTEISQELHNSICAFLKNESYTDIPRDKLGQMKGMISLEIPDVTIKDNYYAQDFIPSRTLPEMREGYNIRFVKVKNSWNEEVDMRKKRGRPELGITAATQNIVNTADGLKQIYVVNPTNWYILYTDDLHITNKLKILFFYIAIALDGIETSDEFNNLHEKFTTIETSDAEGIEELTQTVKDYLISKGFEYQSPEKQIIQKYIDNFQANPTQELEGKITQLETQINELMRDIYRITKEKEQNMSLLIGMKYGNEKLENKKDEFVQFIENHKNLRLLGVNTRTGKIYIEAKGILNYYGSTPVNKIQETLEHYRHTEYARFAKILEHRDRFQIHMWSAIALNLKDNYSHTIVDRQGNLQMDTSLSKPNLMPNPHHSQHNCLGPAEQDICRALTNNDLIRACSAFLATTTSINIRESAAMNTMARRVNDYSDFFYNIPTVYDTVEDEWLTLANTHRRIEGLEEKEPKQQRQTQPQPTLDELYEGMTPQEIQAIEVARRATAAQRERSLRGLDLQSD